MSLVAWNVSRREKSPHAVVVTRATVAACDDHAARFPLSRWYLLPVLRRGVDRLVDTRCRPTHLTLLGAAIALATALVVVKFPSFAAWGSCGVWLVWCCDRADGMLARRQGSSTRRGAWLDANIDELVDVGLHAVVAHVAATRTASSAPWMLFAAFVAGKYLWTFGRSDSEPSSVSRQAVERSPGWTRRLVEAAGNADVRIHVLVGALLGDWLVWELAYTALYFNARWLARYAMFASRAREAGP